MIWKSTKKIFNFDVLKTYFLEISDPFFVHALNKSNTK